jgi:hypothetical protein
LQENTPAILWLYTQDLKSFVSRARNQQKRELCDAQAVIISKDRTKRLAPITQNAGCTMAIHAICTKSKILKNCKILIYNAFL